jgi:hypothetical protein
MSDATNGKGEWRFCLYVAGDGESSRIALNALREFQFRFLGSAAPVEVVDLGANGDARAREEFLVVPTAVRVRPRPKVVIPAPRSVEDVVRYLRVAGAGVPES